VRGFHRYVAHSREYHDSSERFISGDVVRHEVTITADDCIGSLVVTKTGLPGEFGQQAVTVQWVSRALGSFTTYTIGAAEYDIGYLTAGDTWHRLAGIIRSGLFERYAYVLYPSFGNRLWIR